MSSAKPASLGVISCPGGEDFANQIISHLSGIYQHRFEKKLRYIARLYGMRPEKVQRHLNFADDLLSHRVRAVGSADSQRTPSYKIPCDFIRFANGEIKAEILQSVRDLDIYLVQDVANEMPVKIGGEWLLQSVNDHLISLMTAIDAAHQAGAKRISLVLPCYPYGRQHRKRSREGLGASMVGRIFENLGVARIITLDIHSREIEHAFASLVLENLHASYQILKTANSHIDLINEDLVVVSPDTGAIDRNKFFADSLYKPLALLYKERDYSKVSSDASNSNIKSARLLGDVEGKTVLMADDILGTGGTLIKAMKEVRNMGARKIICTVSLPLFSGEAASYLDEAFNQGFFDLLIGTNAINLPEAVLKRPWYQSADVSSLFAKAINRVHHNRSVSPLLDNSRIIQKMMRESGRPQEPDLFSGIDR